MMSMISIPKPSELPLLLFISLFAVLYSSYHFTLLLHSRTVFLLSLSKTPPVVSLRCPQTQPLHLSTSPISLPPSFSPPTSPLPRSVPSKPNSASAVALLPHSPKPTSSLPTLTPLNGANSSYVAAALKLHLSLANPQLALESLSAS